MRDNFHSRKNIKMASKLSLIDLPSEVIASILLFLDTRDVVAISCTCAHLRYVASETFLWKRVKVSYLKPSDLDVVGLLVKKRGQSIQYLHIHGSVPLGKALAVVGCCRALERLSLFLIKASITTLQIDTLLSNIATIRSLSLLISASQLASVLSRKSSMNILHHLALYVQTPTRVEPLHYLDAWAKNSYRPQHFELHLNYQLPGTLSSLYTMWYTHVQPNLPTPSCQKVSTFTLCLQCVCTGYKGTCKPDFQIVVGGKDCPSVYSLYALNQELLGIEVGGCIPIVSHNGRSLASFIPSVNLPSLVFSDLSKITHLNLSHLTSMIPQHVSYIAQSCHQLVALCMNGCSNAFHHLSGFEMLIGGCHRLKYLGISGISNSKVDCVNFWRILSLSRIRLLTVSNCFFNITSPTKSPRKTSEQDQLAMHFRKLMTLNYLELVCCNSLQNKPSCVSCSSISDSQLELIHSFSNLVHMSLRTTTTRGFPKAMKHIFTDCQLIKNLRFEYRSLYSCLGFGSITLPCPSQETMYYKGLTQLCLVSASYCIPDALCDLLGQLGKLTHLYIFVDHISIKAIEVLLRGNSKLTSVVILMRKSHGKSFKDFVKRLMSALNTCYAVLAGQCVIEDNCSRKNDRDIQSDLSVVDLMSDLGPLWLSV